MIAKQRRILVTGGLGFIGSSLIAALLKDELNYIAIVDNYWKRSVQYNARDPHPRVTMYYCDIADERRMHDLFLEVRPTHIYHLAAQTAVTKSFNDPEEDFQTNVVGTWTLLRLTKKFASSAVFVYASTNKVYGSEVSNEPISALTHPINPMTPYGVSKASAEMMVTDAVRFNGLLGVSLRQSCIYGPLQQGTFDQGWVSNFVQAVAANNKPKVFVTGDGEQRRDILYIDDLIDLYLKFLDPSNIVKVRNQKCGSVLDVGGGPENSVRIIELLEYLAEISGADIDAEHLPDRPGDQRCFTANIQAAKSILGWPGAGLTPWKTGVELCYRQAKSSGTR